jgi:hypothetical protein
VLPAAFYTVADERYFPGAVALLNSLRLVGHEEPLFVADCGLRADQRELLRRGAEVLAAPEGVFVGHVKWYGPSEAPADVMVHLDADIIVVRSLRPLIERAAAGAVVAFEDLDRSRFCPEWEPLLALGPLRRRTYLNTGVVALPRDPGLDLMARMRTLLGRIETGGTYWEGGRKQGNPFFYTEQDVLNALLMAELPDERVHVVERRLMAHARPAGGGGYDGLRPPRRRTLACRLAGGTSPYVLHHWGRQKPWLERTPPTPYSILLSRLLFWRDLPVRLDPADYPPWLHAGPVAARLGAARLRARTARPLVERVKGKARYELRRLRSSPRASGAGPEG